MAKFVRIAWLKKFHSVGDLLTSARRKKTEISIYLWCLEVSVACYDIPSRNEQRK